MSAAFLVAVMACPYLTAIGCLNECVIEIGPFTLLFVDKPELRQLVRYSSKLFLRSSPIAPRHNATIDIESGRSSFGQVKHCGRDVDIPAQAFTSQTR